LPDVTGECPSLIRTTATAFRKVVSERKLWSFDKKEPDVWKAAL
jgi:hypothetical protein